MFSLTMFFTSAYMSLFPVGRISATDAKIREKENGLLFVPKGQAQNAQAQMFSDPNMAMDMMKKNLSMIIPQFSFLFLLLNFDLRHVRKKHNFNNMEDSLFFSPAKIPFPLTQRFRSMLQNGIDYSTIDVSYVSTTDDTQRMMQMSGFGFDPSKHKGGYDVTVVLGTAGQSSKKNHFTISLGAEKDGLDIIQHEWALPKFEQRAEAMLRKLIS
ncbi:hypothetical protein TEA_014479 [Camellia sinensis var. sinensis]|uniref:ER membrane protein complex subunit 3 n=1 Tax=Camellia sinensis var. sinensis TaxID=542762 RepID=A0A4S4DL39_CAMSN|nr:hypothetical protein TEA_014479 [Camellia sinensis var. sinensis]